MTPDQVRSTYQYADERIIEIHEVEEFGRDPIAVTTFRIPGEAVEDHDTIPLALLGRLYGHDGFDLRDSRSIYECGASAAQQAIELAVISGAAGGLATAIVTYTIERVRDWCGRSSEDVLVATPDDHQVELILDSIRRSYGAYGELTLIEHSTGPSGVHLVAKDSADVRYEGSFDSESGSTKIKKRKRRRS